MLESHFLEYLAFRQPGFFQSFQQGFGLDGLIALKLDGVNGRPFLDNNNEYIAIPANLHVIEIFCLEKRSGDTSYFSHTNVVTDIVGNRTEHGSSRNSLQPFHTNVRDYKSISCRCPEQDHGYQTVSD